MPPFRTLLLVLPLLGGCAEYPELDALITPEARAAAYPGLVPVREITDRRKLARTTGKEGPALAARAAALRARARLLRGVAIDDDTRRRLTPTLTRLGG